MQTTDIDILKSHYKPIRNFLVSILVMHLNFSPNIAQSTDSLFIEKNDTTVIDIEITGLVFDETMTKIGKDFYDMFYNKWEFPKSGDNFFITVSEKPMPGMGTRINIVIDDNLVFEQFVRPNYEQMVILTDYAVNILNNYIINYEAMKRQLDEGDQAGSGIF